MQCGALPSQITSQDIQTLLENCLHPLPCSHGSVFRNFMDIGPKCAVIWPRNWALPAWVCCAFSICVQRAWAVSGASLPGVSRASSINRWSSFWQDYSRLISFGLSDGAGWRQNTPGLNANAVPGAGRRAVYYSSRMCLGVQWSVKTQMQNQSYLPLVLSWPHCPLLLPTLLSSPIIWSVIWRQELRPCWEGTFNLSCTRSSF